ncbi:MAG: sigma-54-dependent transcriptional regulator [Candidatus Brocadiia bacterium]
MPEKKEKSRGQILVIDDRKNMLKMMEDLLGDHFDVRTKPTGEEGLAEFRESPPDVVVSDIRMHGKDGMDVLRSVKEENPETEVILMTAYGEVEQAVESLKAGAYDYLAKPFEPDEMVLTIEKAIERKRLRQRTAALEKEVESRFGLGRIVGESEPIEKARELACKAASSDATVMLTGESGTGKELFARAIHYASTRSEGRFVAINCAAIPQELIESELFGHVKGAFSGASEDKPGLFEQADKGTLLLDEITELPHNMQGKINRAIQEREIRRVGDTQDRPVDPRIIAASNRDLEEAIQENRFRKDLYFRLNVFPIHLPPLRNRTGDVPLLVRHFLQELVSEENEHYSIEPDAMQKLTEYKWPGNVRELRNCIERAIVLCDDGRITAEMFQLESGLRKDLADSVPEDLPYKDAMEAMKTEARRRYVKAVLQKFDGNVTRAAEFAGIERESFHRLMRQCDVSADDVR